MPVMGWRGQVEEGKVAPTREVVMLHLSPSFPFQPLVSVVGSWTDILGKGMHVDDDGRGFPRFPHHTFGTESHLTIRAFRVQRI